MPLNHTHATQILIPGWHGSGPDHWQQHWWRSAAGSQLLEQDDWLTPRRRDWVKRLDDAVQGITDVGTLTAAIPGYLALPLESELSRSSNMSSSGKGSRMT